jgi:hypothetical protein
MLETLCGLRVVTNANLVVEDGQEEVRRPWRERLFARPWRPFKATKIVTRFKPDPNLYVIGNRTVACHPETAARTEREIRAKLQSAPLTCSGMGTVSNPLGVVDPSCMV